jgi:methionyl aminopeptidase
MRKEHAQPRHRTALGIFYCPPCILHYTHPHMSTIHVFSAGELRSFREAGVILRDCLKMLPSHVKAGVTTMQLDQIAEAFIRERGGKPAFKGYHGYPSTICTSINEECVHGMPSDRALEEGDIVSLDCGVIIDGFYTDACITVGVGQIDADAAHLLDVTEKALNAAVKIIKAGTRVGDISAIIEQTALAGNCTPVRSLTGHGLGRDLHEYPDIPNSGKAGTGPELPAGTVIAVEPILSLGGRDVRTTGDGWTIETDDGALSAHFEHTILVTEGGCEVLA